MSNNRVNDSDLSKCIQRVCVFVNVASCSLSISNSSRLIQGSFGLPHCYARIYMEMMRTLKPMNLWATGCQLAEKRGKWITGTKKLKSSEAYPVPFGRCICNLLQNPLAIERARRSIVDEVVEEIRAQKDKERFGQWGKIGGIL